jgi:hypothetical protein
MRSAKSYSIVDHALYHGGYLHRLSHEAMALYLFLVVVGDREGRSFYGEATLGEILRLGPAALAAARSALLREELIDFRKPYWWVKSLSHPAAPKQPRSVAQSPSPGSAADRDAQPPSPAEAPLDRETARRRLRDIRDALASERSA